MHIALLILISVAVLLAMYKVGLYGFMASIFSLAGATNLNDLKFLIFGYVIALLTIALEISGLYCLWHIWF